VKISLVVCLDNVVDTIQRCHHNIGANHIPLGNDCAVHNFGSEKINVKLGALQLRLNESIFTSRSS
jgi:hypothetical protein